MALVCPNCARETAVAVCPACGTAVVTVDPAAYPPVTWEEIRAHLIERLMIDPEWLVIGERSFTWWPWIWPQTFSVVGEGIWTDDPRDNFVTVEARSTFARVPEQLGRDLCGDANGVFPLGSFVWEDGQLSVVTTLCLSRENRDLLHLFHEAALAQATAVQQLGFAWASLEGFSSSLVQHPTSGVRESADELLYLFRDGERRELPGSALPQVAATLEPARPLIRQMLEDLGWQHVDSRDQLDLFGRGEVAMTIGQVKDDFLTRKYGPGYTIMVTMATPGLDPNEVARAIAAHPSSSLLGSIRPTGNGERIAYAAYVPSGIFVNNGITPERVAGSAVHAAIECSNAVRQYLDARD